MTTLRQKLVRKKNRKLRRLRELYPAINIKLFYARDFRALMLKYGKVALADGLSGTSGQVALPYGPSPRTSTRAATRAAAGDLAGPSTRPALEGARRPARRRPLTAPDPEGSAIQR
jgi:hypothetical protein